MKLEIESNPRLDGVFAICEMLGVDDPIYWMNNTKPIVIDWWIAYLTLKAEREERAHEGTDTGKQVDPEDAFEYFNNMAKK